MVSLSESLDAVDRNIYLRPNNIEHDRDWHTQAKVELIGNNAFLENVFLCTWIISGLMDKIIII